MGPNTKGFSGHVKKCELRSLKMQDRRSKYKIQSYFCILAMNKPKMKLRTVAFTIPSKRVQYLGLNLTKAV